MNNLDIERTEIHLDAAGITFLKQQLEYLEKLGKQEHLHLMTKAWGGDELTIEFADDPKGKLVNHLVLYRWEK